MSGYREFPPGFTLERDAYPDTPFDVSAFMDTLKPGTLSVDFTDRGVLPRTGETILREDVPSVRKGSTGSFADSFVAFEFVVTRRYRRRDGSVRVWWERTSPIRFTAA